MCPQYVRHKPPSVLGTATRVDSPEMMDHKAREGRPGQCTACEQGFFHIMESIKSTDYMNRNNLQANYIKTCTLIAVSTIINAANDSNPTRRWSQDYVGLWGV